MKHRYARMYKRRSQKKRTKLTDMVGVSLMILVIIIGLQYVVDMTFMWNLILLVISIILVIIASIGLYRLWVWCKKFEQRVAWYRSRETLDQLMCMDHFEFEHYVAWVFEEQGYWTKTTVARGDNGIDVEMKKQGSRYAVQVKHYTGNIGEPAVREFYGSFRDDFEKGVFVTTSDYTKQARAWVKGKPIELLNGADLVGIMEKNKKQQKK